MASDDSKFYEKELSWLAFNERVLQEAADPNTPLIQRLRYLGITSNNNDEFFRVRVADVSRLASFTKDPEDKLVYQKLLTRIQDKALKLQQLYDATYAQILKELRRRKIYLIDESQIDDVQSKTVTQIFDHQVLPELNPILINKPKDFPDIDDGSIYLAVRIVDRDNVVRYALVNIPTNRLPRFFQIPQRKGHRGKAFIVLENIIRHGLPKVFRGVFDIKSVDAYEFKVTRDAELEMGEGIDQSLIDRISKSLKKRRSADPERFVLDSKMPEDLKALLRRALKLDKYDSIMPGGRYHNAKDFIGFPSVGPAYLEFKPLPIVPVPELAAFDSAGLSANIFSTIREKDVLLYYPYHSFDTIVHMIKTAAIDPAVKSIKLCLYRAASNSKIINALTSAVRNRKRVQAVVELQARFDEEANIGWARELTEAGVNVTFGVTGLKVHSKLILIERVESGKTRYYSHVGTGNFNEKTAKLYTDFSLLTYDQAIGRDLIKVFDFVAFTYKHHQFEKILVSPHSNRNGLLALVQREIDHAYAGKTAEINIKCNNLVDPAIIEALYEASEAGVRIRIICRGMFAMKAGVPGLSDNIEAISIVDRYLEHPRVYIFHNAGKREYYISSADLMTRNLDYRVEVSAPVEQPQLRERLQAIFDIQWCDNVKARILDAEQRNQFRPKTKGQKIRSQEIIHRYLKTGEIPLAVKRARKQWAKALAANAANAGTTRNERYKKRMRESLGQPPFNPPGPH